MSCNIFKGLLKNALYFSGFFRQTKLYQRNKNLYDWNLTMYKSDGLTNFTEITEKVHSIIIDTQ